MKSMNYMAIAQEQLTRHAWEVALNTARRRWQNKIVAAEMARIERDKAEEEYSKVFSNRPTCNEEE